MARYLAIDFDRSGLAVALATVERGKVALDEAFVLAPDPTAPDGFALDAALAARLRDALKAEKIKSAPLLAVLGRQQVIVKDVRYPTSAPEDEPAVVRFQAVRDLADAADDVLMDYCPLGADAPRAGGAEGAEGGEKRAQVYFLRKQVAAQYQAFADAAGLKLAALTPRPFAVAEAVGAHLGGGEAGAVAVLALSGPEGGGFTVCRAGAVLFSRAVSAGAVASPAALASELKRNLTVAGGQAGVGALGQLLVCESPEVGLSAQLAPLLPVPVRSFDPLAGRGAEADLVPSPQRGHFAGPLGLLALKASHPVLPINFTQPRQPKSDPTPARARIALGGLAAALVILTAGALGYRHLDSLDRELAAAQAEQVSLKKQTDALSFDAARLGAIAQFEERDVNVLDDLYDLASRVPDVSKLVVADYDLAIKPPEKAKQSVASATAAGPSPVAGLVARKRKLSDQPTVATLRLNFRSNDTAVARRLLDSFQTDRDPYVEKSVAANPQDGGEKGGKLYQMTAEYRRRPPSEYARRLDGTPPNKRPAPADDLFGAADDEAPAPSAVAGAPAAPTAESLGLPPGTYVPPTELPRD